MPTNQKKYEELELSDDFMFGKIMRNPVYCREMLERLLNIEIAAIEFPDDQKTIDISYESKGIRLDIYVKDEAQTVYNVDIQARNTGELPKRVRYYSSLIDMNLLEKGALYKDLNRSFVIFICTFDLFGRDFYQYTFENMCKEDTSLLLNDESTKIFFNTEGSIGDISDEAKAFLHYIGGHPSDDAFVQELEKEVEKARKNEEWRQEYMNLLIRDQENREAGRQEGLAEGRAEGLEKGAHDRSIENATAMLSDGMDFLTVAKYSGLHIEEVEALARL